MLDDIDDLIVPLYCGPKNMKPSLSTITYIPFRDLHQGDFIIACPCELEVYLV
jgi:hypothetical protein